MVEIGITGTLKQSPIDLISSLILKPTAEGAGRPVAGAAVAVTHSLFWIGLLNEQIGSNLNLIRDSSWLEISILFRDQTRGLISFEKGIPGDMVIEAVLAEWTAEEVRQETGTKVNSSSGNPASDGDSLQRGLLPIPVQLTLPSKTIRSEPNEEATPMGVVGGGVWIERSEENSWVLLAGGGYVWLDEAELQSLSDQLARGPFFPLNVTVSNKSVYLKPIENSRTSELATGIVNITSYAGDKFYRISGEEEQYIRIEPAALRVSLFSGK